MSQKQTKKTHRRVIPNTFNKSLSIKRLLESRDCDVIRRSARVPRRMDRLKGLGNSIIPQIAELLFNLIKKSL